MKNEIDLIGTFTLQKDENGKEYYAGSIHPAPFKKAKEELQLVLMPGHQLPASLIGNGQDAKDSLFLFSQSNG